VAFFLAAGVSRECANALDDLEKTGLRNHLSPAGQAKWDEVAKIRDRWYQNTFVAKIRNKAGFHIDPKVVDRGLQAIIAEGGQMSIVEGTSRAAKDNHFVFADLALIHGVAPEMLLGPAQAPPEVKDAVEDMANDQARLSDLLQRVMLSIEVK
jgi:hypothetical protein